jgi:hypothetical protein
LRYAQAHNAVLEEEPENVKGLCGGRVSWSWGALKSLVEELEGDNEDLRAKLEEQAETIAQREEGKEDLTDEIEAL